METVTLAGTCLHLMGGKINQEGRPCASGARKIGPLYAQMLRCLGLHTRRSMLGRAELRQSEEGGGITSDACASFGLRTCTFRDPPPFPKVEESWLIPRMRAGLGALSDGHCHGWPKEGIAP